jgi:hypothetical protein
MVRTSLGILLLILNRPDGLEPTDRLALPGWKGDPWGPAATRARARGEPPPIPMTPPMRRWDRWGRIVLRDGDIVFRRGDAQVLFGYFPFSRFIANASGSPFSHTGVVAVEEDGPVVDDTTKAGVHRRPFAVRTLDNVGPLGVKRLRPEHRSKIGRVIDFCQQVVEEQVPFDYHLSLDDRELYCVEMAEKAFRAAGLRLSEPVRLGDMENAAKFPIRMFAFQALSAVTLDEPLSLDQPVFFPGNERHGIWSSPLHEAVYPHPPTRSAARGERPKG